MITPMNKTCLLLAAYLILAPSLYAQTLAKDTTVNRTVVVEQQYNPEIMDAQKVNVLPQVNDFATTPNEVEYDRNMLPVAILPGTAMAAYTGEEKQQLAKQGYLRLGYGNIGNVDVEGNYLFNLSPKDKLNLSLGMQGMNGEVYTADLFGDVPHLQIMEKWDSRYYRSKAGLDYIRQFANVDFNVSGNFGLSNFNYIPYALPTHQRFTSGDLRFGVLSTDPSLPLRFNLEAGLSMYGRAHNPLLYEINDITYGISEDKNHKIKETNLHAKGDLTGDISDNQQVGVAFALHNLRYNHDLFEDYSTLLLRPYYEIGEVELWKLRLGVNVDVAFGYGRTLRASPDVRAEYIFSDRYVLYGSATGGRVLNDFRRLEQLNPYAETIGQLGDSYEQLHAAAGIKMSPATGLWFNLYGGYKIIKDDLYDANGFFYHSNDITDSSHATDAFLHTAFLQANTKNAYGGLQVNYSYKDVIGFLARGEYHHWNIEEFDYPLLNIEDLGYALRYKPKYRLDTQVDFRPVSLFNINLAYTYLKRATTNNSYLPDVENLSNLSLGATYDLFEGMSIYARVSNLLNRKAPYYPSSPVPGINFLGGVIFSF